MDPTVKAEHASARKPTQFARVARSLGGLRLHGPSLIVFVVCASVFAGVFVSLAARGHERERAVFNAQAAPIVANLRSAFELPLEILEATATFFEASSDVTRAEFARFVKPALERHPGIRALEWIPIVPADARARYEAAARTDGLTGFEFRERNANGAMVTAERRPEHMPIFYMEPPHPLVLGFDCTSERERFASAENARTRGSAYATERIQLIDDPPSSFSIAVFQPVFDPSRPRIRDGVRGLTCEVFRIRAVAERAIEDGVRRGIQVLLLDPEAPPGKRLLFESVAGLLDSAPPALHLGAPLRYANRNWRIELSAGPSYRGAQGAPTWFVLVAGMSLSALLAVGMSTARIITRLRRQVDAAQQFGQYTLLGKLGQGGVGVVYKARHAMLRRPTAVKLLAEQTHDRRRLARFEREVQLTSELTHPHTIAIYDYGRTPDGVFYYAMEYVDGITLEQLVEADGPLPAARVRHFLMQACDAIAEAHAVGLVHRDVKPANLMICKRGGIPDFLKVMDFGLVKDLGTDPSRDLAMQITESTTMTVVGTPLYLAPEAILRPTEVDLRADLYALGAVAYYLLVGEPVFSGHTVVEVCGHHLHSPVVPPGERTDNAVPPSLERIVMRCLEKSPADRFASAKALLAALAAATDVAAWSEADAAAWWQRRGDALMAALRAEAADASDSGSSQPA
jgi:CHASE1-domain containing sensor protein/tRNA A-37 threonylcarbamoyl transferase component Bud32